MKNKFTLWEYIKWKMFKFIFNIDIQETKSEIQEGRNIPMSSDSSPDNCQDSSGVDTSTTNEGSDIQSNILPDTKLDNCGGI